MSVKKLFIGVAALLLCLVLLFVCTFGLISGNMPTYRDSAGNDNYTEKITGLYLVKESAAREDNLIIYGSSELRTTDISTHPSNFFSGKRSGFQVNLVGMGSCQSIIHAISIGTAGDALIGKKVALITSPQSYVSGGIAPDLFMANFSEQQYLELLRDKDISDEVKQYISMRVQTLYDRYDAMPDTSKPDAAIRYLAEYHADPSPIGAVQNAVLSPYYTFSQYLYDIKDKTSARALLESIEDTPLPSLPSEIDWELEAQSAISEAEKMTANNDYGMLDDYYITYIGSRLSRQKGQDSALDYSESEEYDDLRILFEVCRQKGIEPLFIHVPLHGEWSDYTGLTAERRRQYYDNVRDITAEYGIQILDLTGYEYEEYFLCDVMHLGWKGWLEVDRALIKYYHDR